MNVTLQFTSFFDRIGKDKRLSPTHVSLFVALIYYWIEDDFRHPMAVCRRELMETSKIKAKGTYHKCIRELHDYGYIIYNPSYNPYRPTEIFFKSYPGTESL